MTEQISAIAAMAEENVRKWLRASHVQKRLASGSVQNTVGPYLAISRESGAGGSEIARMVASELGWDVLDKEIVDYLAAKYGKPRSLVDLVDEKHISWIEEVFTSWIESQGFSSATYADGLIRLLLLAAHHGNVVIVGRGAQFVLPKARGLAVRILAPLDFRIEQTLLRDGVTAKEARKHVMDADRRRDAFVKEHFRHKADDPHIYDLVINVAKLVQADAADVIVKATRSWMKKSGVTTAPS